MAAPAWAGLIHNVEWLARPARALPAARVTVHHDERPERYFGLRPAELSERTEEFPAARVEASLAAMGWSAAQVDAAIAPLRALWSKRDPTRNFNGDVARLEEFELKDDALTLRTARTSWWTLMISNFALRGTIFDDVDTRRLGALLEPESRAGLRPDAKLANGMAVHVTAVTADDKIVVVKRGNQGTEAGLWASSCSGSIQGSEGNPFLTARRELAEELGLDVSIAQLGLQGLVVQNPERDPLLLFRARLALTFDEIRRRRQGAVDRHESTRIVALDLGERGRAQLAAGFSAGGVSVPAARDGRDWQQTALASILMTLDEPPPP